MQSRIIEEDLTTEGEPSEGYWKTLAEKRRVALDISLKENEELHEKVGTLEEELSISRAMLQESQNLVELLTEIIHEQEGEANDSGLPNNINADLSMVGRSMVDTDSNHITDSTSDEAADDTCDEGAITDDDPRTE